MKLKEGFFDTDEILMLESLPNGILYSNILLKLYCRSLKNEGRLAYNDRIPYNTEMIAKFTRQDVDVVEKALKLFRDLDLIEILDNGTIYITDIQNFIGKSSNEADRKREYRSKIESEKKLIEEKSNLVQVSDTSPDISQDNQRTNVGQMSGQCPDKSPPEIRDKNLESRDKNLESKDKDLKSSLSTTNIDIDSQGDREPVPESTVEEKQKTDDNDNIIKSIVNFIQVNGFGVAYQYALDDINVYLDQDMIEPGLILKALKCAVDNNARTWAYVKTCLDNWININITTVAAQEAHEIQWALEKAKRKKSQNFKNAVKSTSDFDQRTYSDDFYDSLYVNGEHFVRNSGCDTS